MTTAVGSDPVRERDESSRRSATPPSPLAGDIRSLFALDFRYVFLNHGSFGAAPRAVLEAQDRWRREIEARPIEMLGRRSDELIDRGRLAAAKFLGATIDNLGFVTNATEAVNAILRSIDIRAGEMLLTTTHVYNAIRQTMKHVASRAGGRMIEVDVPLPLRWPDAIVNALAGAITDRTRLIVIDHVTSPTAIRFPVERIMELASSRGIDVLVDGAHAPGMIELEIESLGAAYYVGNLHKWVCAPKGAGFIWVRPDRQAQVHPAVISHHLGEGFANEFSWQGTRDITPWICVADAIEYLGQFGWENVRRHNHAMATWAQRMLCETWQVEPASPIDGSMLGSMATVALPDSLRRFEKPEALAAMLFEQHRIEVPVVDWGGRWWVRVSCQIYNKAEDYEQLARAVLDAAAA
jgi:isopenicillin-N epimerase